MSLASEKAALSAWLNGLPRKAMPIVGGEGSPMCVLDFIFLGAVKRSLSLAAGLLALIEAKNIVCARAVLRMHLDTITRLSAYSYVSDPGQMASEILGGKALNKFKSTDGKPLTDGYLVDRLSDRFPWVRKVYDFTSGYVHFSERQFFDAIHSLGSNEERTMRLSISRTDDKYPEFSWEELPACFNHLNLILEELLRAYADRKPKGYPLGQPDRLQAALRLLAGSLRPSASAGRLPRTLGVLKAMRILSVHQRELAAPLAEVGALLDSLASDHDALWPGKIWPRMHFDRPLAVGANGGHGPVAYAVEDYRPGQMIQFRFLGPRGFNGHHRFEVASLSEGNTLLRHTIDARVTDIALITWPVAIRPLHDALLEDALAQAQASLGLAPVMTPWSAWVKLLRWLMFGSRARPQQTPNPAVNRTCAKSRAGRLP